MLFQNGPYVSHKDRTTLHSLGVLVSILANTDQTCGVFNAFEVVCPTGFSTPLHIHYAEDVAIYVLEGTLTVFWQEEKKQGRAGSYFFQPRGTPHGFRVEGKSPARIIYMTTPAGFDGFVIEHATEQFFQCMRDAARYKIELLSPLSE